MGSNISMNDLIQQQMRGNWKVVTLVDGVTAGAGEFIASAGEDVSLYSKLVLEVQTTDTCLVMYQTSNDNVNWFDPLLYPNGTDDVTDVCETYDVVNEKRSIAVTRSTRYIRVYVKCTAAATVTVKLFAQM